MLKKRRFFNMTTPMEGSTTAQQGQDRGFWHKNTPNTHC